jgi:hypothetical protein
MRFTLIAAVTVAALALTGCGATAPATPAIPPAAPTTSAPVDSAPPEASSTPVPVASPVQRIKIPAVVGKNHQLAQDTMQAAGLYNLREEDATGQGRILIWDRNWVVVRQNPPARRRVPPNTVITLYSKKIGE